ncbi:MAG: ParA family protein [Pseudomonadota bacterium]
MIGPKIISAATSKGGASKSTTIGSIAGAFAKRGASVHVIDADPKLAVSEWMVAQDPKVENITSVAVKPDDFSDYLDDQDFSVYDYVLIDVAGYNDKTLMLAMARSNLILVPLQPAATDLRHALETVKAAKTLYKNFGKSPLYRLVLSNIDHLAMQEQIFIFKEIMRLKLDRFNTPLTHRKPYKTMQLTGYPPHFQEQTLSVSKAVAEVDMLIAEIDKLIGNHDQRKVA